MVEKVKPLKVEPAEGDIFPTETDPSEDYLAARGLAIEDSDNLLYHSLGGELAFNDPVLGERNLKTLKTLNFSYFDINNPFLSNKETTFAVMGRFIWNGTTHSIAPLVIQTAAFMSAAGATGAVRLHDLTNNVTLGTSATINSTTPLIYSISTSNWSSSPSIIEVQLRRIAGSGNARISSLELHW